MDRNLYKEIGSRIRSIRESLGLSQEEVAVQLGYKSVATISHFETGSRKISVIDLQKIAEMMHVSVDYLVGTEQLIASQEMQHQLKFRAQGIIPSVRFQLEPFLLFAEHNARMPELISHNIAKDTSGGIGRIAMHYLDALEINEPPVLSRQVAKELNVPVYDWPLPNNVSGLSFFIENRVCIGVNEQHPFARQQFSIAHELGHVLLCHHSESTQDVQDVYVGIEFNDMEAAGLWRNEDSAREQENEREANWFAADLLMPKPWLLRDFELFGVEKLQQFAQKYSVSEQALWIQLVSLKLVEKNGGRSK